MATGAFGKSHPDLIIYILVQCARISDESFKRDLLYMKAAGGRA